MLWIKVLMIKSVQNKAELMGLAAALLLIAAPAARERPAVARGACHKRDRPPGGGCLSLTPLSLWGSSGRGGAGRMSLPALWPGRGGMCVTGVLWPVESEVPLRLLCCPVELALE